MEKTRILVLGGGVASLGTIFEITSQPGWSERFDITVLQQGWRLGGKCASSRDPAARGRNEEHGLHILGGFYHNTFKMLADCYKEWERHFPHAIAYDDAFDAQKYFYLAEQDDCSWTHIRMQLPPTDCDAKKPGVNPTSLTPWALAGFLMRLVADYSHIALPAGLLLDPGAMPAPESTENAEGGDGGNTIQKTFKDFAAEVAGALDWLDFTDLGKSDANTLLADACTKLGNRLRTPEISGLGPGPLLTLMEMAIVVSRGIIADDIHLLGFDCVNHIESRQWLRNHGASESLLESTFVNSGYEWAFAYEDGDRDKKNMAAGVCLRGFLRMLATYHGAPFMHMNGGMGEIVVTPLYEVLKMRGVTFRFFHQVSHLNLNDDGTAIASIEGVRQATPNAGEDGYEPLIEWDKRMAWPPVPKYDLLTDGDELERQGADLESFWADSSAMARFKLDAETDFDVVILGIAVGALKTICKPLAERHDNWKNLLATQKTTPTIAAQVWLANDVNELGWPAKEPPLVTGFTLPLSTWCDMSNLLRHEGSRPGPQYQNLAYFCGPYPRAASVPMSPAPQFPKNEAIRAENSFKAWLKHHLVDLMPFAVDPATGEFHTDLEAEIYVRSNINPSDEYVLSAAGTIEARFRTDETNVHNLYVVGDWIKTGIDVGAVEAAVTAAMQCSRAITGRPQYIYGETDFP